MRVLPSNAPPVEVPAAPARRSPVGGYSALLTVIALLFFSAGYLFGHVDGRYGTGPLSRSGLLGPLPEVLASGGEGDFHLLREALVKIERTYYKRDTLDDETLVRGAVKGLVDAVGDPYTSYLTPSERAESDAELHGSFDGIGVQIDVQDGRVRVVAPLDGSPAQQAGLAPGDLLLAVDGRPVTAQSLQDVVGQVRGPRGTTVVLTVQRAGRADPFDVSVTRGEIRTESVRGRLIDDGNVAYVRVSTFAEPTGQQLRQHLKTLLESNPSGIVLDLRGNPGGRLAAAVEVTSQFLREGVVLYQQRDAQGAEQRPYRASGNPVAPDTPLVVLVDHGSASASEIVAAALRDNNRAILIGERTFGKGTVQELHNLSDDSQIRVTIGQWVTPAGRVIQGEGVMPDVAVERGAAGTGQDAALEEAVRHFGATRVAARG